MTILVQAVMTTVMRHKFQQRKTQRMTVAKKKVLSHEHEESLKTSTTSTFSMWLV
jgi:hypothetical protein